jgi:hypothetical protein
MIWQNDALNSALGFCPFCRKPRKSALMGFEVDFVAFGGKAHVLALCTRPHPDWPWHDQPRHGAGPIRTCTAEPVPGELRPADVRAQPEGLWGQVTVRPQCPNPFT